MAIGQVPELKDVPFFDHDINIPAIDAVSQDASAPPNIVYILWDDMTFGAVGFPALQKNFGYTTPNLNRLAREGINCEEFCYYDAPLDDAFHHLTRTKE